jgi:hypothetical protein
MTVYAFVMPGLVPGIHVFAAGFTDVDGRDKPGHDGENNDEIPGSRVSPAPRNDASRQLASASSESWLGCGSIWVWSVRWVG